jgi:hypothetical protein
MAAQQHEEPVQFSMEKFQAALEFNKKVEVTFNSLQMVLVMKQLLTSFLFYLEPSQPRGVYKIPRDFARV